MFERGRLHHQLAEDLGEDLEARAALRKLPLVTNSITSRDVLLATPTPLPGEHLGPFFPAIRALSLWERGLPDLNR